MTEYLFTDILDCQSQFILTNLFNTEYILIIIINYIYFDNANFILIFPNYQQSLFEEIRYRKIGTSKFFNKYNK